MCEQISPQSKILPRSLQLHIQEPLAMARFVFLLLPALAVAASSRTACGGIYNWKCASTQVCVDDPQVNCVSGHGGYDCPAFCMPKTAVSEPAPTVG